MQDVSQSYSEEEYQQQHQLVNKDFKTFIIETPRRIPQLIAIAGYFVAMSVVVILYVNFPKMTIAFAIGFITTTVAFLVVMITLAYKCINQKIVEMYADKMIIRGKETKTISFSDIGSYRLVIGRGNVYLTIRLKDGDKTELSASSGKGPDELTTAFDIKMQELIRDKNYNIKKLHDWPNIVLVTLLGITLIIILLKAFHVI